MKHYPLTRPKTLTPNAQSVYAANLLRAAKGARGTAMDRQANETF